MYYYIVDPQKISQREFERVQNLLYSSLSQYRVSGEVVRVTGLRTINQLVETAFAHGVKTLVAVGGDDTLHDMINAVRGREVVMGFIPIFETEIGKILGVKNIPQAAKTLGSRRITEMDLGMVNNTYFLSKLSFGLNPGNTEARFKFLNFKLIRNLFKLPSFEVKFDVTGEYQGSLKVIGGMILNSRDSSDQEEKLANPIDGVLDILLLSKLSKWKIWQYRNLLLSGYYEKIPGSSLIHVKKIEISAPPLLPLRVGSRVIAKTPAIVEILPKTLKIIVGKDRDF